MRWCDFCGEYYRYESSYQNGLNIFLGHKKCIDRIREMFEKEESGSLEQE